MKLLLSLLIPIILLSSCTIDWNDEKGAKIMELEKQVSELKKENDSENFKKKEECLNIYEKTNGPGNRYSYDNLSIEIFYSQKKQSCMIKLDGWSKEDGYRVFLIADILSQKTLYSFSVDKDWAIIRQKNLVANELMLLKCEFNSILEELSGSPHFFTTCNQNQPN